MKRVVIAVTGASGQIYARKIIERLRSVGGDGSDNTCSVQTELIFTDTAKNVYHDELGEQPPQPLVNNNNYYNRNASGSNAADVMIIIPCTMGTIGRIASGATTDLISRIAEVQLKERKTLIIVPRETPYSLIHLRNLTTLTEAGAIIAPASPSFYMHPANLEQLADNFVSRILDLAGVAQLPSNYRWKTTAK
ncbi:MAG: UbiX family flavin prenyltransferase [Bacteroidales bacterium]